MWFSLDNAAKVYPAFAKKTETGTFRVAAVMKENVDPTRLQVALNKIMDRFPTMTVELKKGLFWYYFASNKKPLKVTEECKLPCEHIANKNGYLFNVLYYKKRISLEFFHALTDGYGAFEFLKTLLYEYIRLGGATLEKCQSVLHPDDVWKKREIEDSYKKYAKREVSRDINKRAYKIKGNRIPYEGVFVHHFKMSASEILKVAKNYNTTVTVLLAAIYYESIFDPKESKPVVLSIPVNLRKRFKSATLRNFTYIVNVAIEKRERVQLKELINEIQGQLKEKTEDDYLLREFSNNVNAENSTLIKFLPRALKNVVIKIAKTAIFDKRATTFLSNPGKINIPDEMKKHIDFMEFFLYATKVQAVNMGVCTVGDDMVITLSRIIRDKSIIKRFEETLYKRTSVSFQYYSNEGEEDGLS